MPSKEKSKPTKKPFTLEALEAADAQAKAAEQALSAAEQAFDQGDRTSEQFQRIQAAKGEHAFHVRLFDLAAASHDAFIAAESARLAAEVEAARLEALADCEARIASNTAASIAAGEALARGNAMSWNLVIERSGLQGSSRNGWAFEVQDAIGRALIAEGINPGAIRVS
jgi:hypothetical protein